MVRIGITGGIGSGKSTVCEAWESEGAYIINADRLAKDIMTNNEAVKQEIIETFGERAYKNDGQLNKKYLAKQAFEKGRVAELNAIVHPRVPEEVDAMMDTAAEHGYEAVVYEAALLLQNLRPDSLDHIVLVLAPEDKRIGWVQERDDISKQLVVDRIEKQQNFNELTHLADIVLHNDGTLGELKLKAKELYKKIVHANRA